MNDRTGQISIQDLMMQRTPLHVAVNTGSTDAVEALLPKKRMFRRAPNELVNAQDAYGSTPLHIAIKAGFPSHFRIAELLIERGANPNIGDCDGLTPLHYAAWFNRSKEVSFLLSSGSDVSHNSNNWRETPLHTAAWKYGHAVAAILVDAGADVDAVDGVGNTPLHYAAQRLRPKMVEALVELGAVINAKNTKGQIPLDLLPQEPIDSEEAEAAVIQIKWLLANK